VWWLSMVTMHQIPNLVDHKLSPWTKMSTMQALA
jgi:hypothetical protein